MTTDTLLETLTLVSKIAAGGTALCSLAIFVYVRYELSACRLALAYKRGEKDAAGLSPSRRRWIESADERTLEKLETYWNDMLIVPVIFAALTFFLLALLALLRPVTL